MWDIERYTGNGEGKEERWLPDKRKRAEIITPKWPEIAL